MSNLTFKFTKANGKTQHLTLDRVHYLRALNDDERANLAERYEHDTTSFNTAIRFFGHDSDTLATETLEHFQAAIALVNIGNGRFTPAATIHSAESFTKDDAQDLKAKTGRELSNSFRSRVQTVTGETFLTVRHPAQLMESKAKALALSSAPQVN